MEQIKESPLVKLLDIVLVPSSVIRLAHKAVKDGEFQPKGKYKDSEFMQLLSKTIPYVQASIFELARLYGYFALGEYLIKNSFR